jgi:hypothetical protein
MIGRFEMTPYTSSTNLAAYDMGRHAFEDGQQADENPFNPDTDPDLFNAWADGWADAYDDS